MKGRDAAQPADTEVGSATIWVLAAALLLAAAAAVVLARGFVAVDRHRAATVADFAALAAAAHVIDGQPAACALADEVARAGRARLLDCVVSSDGAVVVDVLVPPSGPLAGFAPVRVRARAGPRAAQ